MPLYRPFYTTSQFILTKALPRNQTTSESKAESVELSIFIAAYNKVAGMPQSEKLHHQ
jgi:hypothetical protein